jgi:hypothetical protein
MSIIVLFAGCGLTGKTTRVTLRFDNVVISPQIAAIKVASVKIEAGGIHLQNIDVFPWGAFSDDDLEVLEGSLRDTISAIQPDRESSSEREIYLYVTVRRYFVVSSNHSVGVLAAVSWQAADSDSKPIFQELFYAADVYSGSFPLFRTLGGIKNTVNEIIMRRIIGKSITIATPRGYTNNMTLSTKGTFNTYADAIINLPPEITSTVCRYYSSNKYGSYCAQWTSEIHTIEWHWAQVPEDIDWEEFLLQPIRVIR